MWHRRRKKILFSTLIHPIFCLSRVSTISRRCFVCEPFKIISSFQFLPSSFCLVTLVNAVKKMCKWTKKESFANDSFMSVVSVIFTIKTKVNNNFFRQKNVVKVVYGIIFYTFTYAITRAVGEFNWMWNKNKQKMNIFIIWNSHHFSYINSLLLCGWACYTRWCG